MKMLFALLTLWFGCSSNDGWFTISDLSVSCTITRNTPPDQLIHFKNELWSKKKIQFDIERIEFDLNDKISFVKIHVDCNDSYKGDAQLRFKDSMTQLKFYRNYEKGAASPFGFVEIVDEIKH